MIRYNQSYQAENLFNSEATTGTVISDTSDGPFQREDKEN